MTTISHIFQDLLLRTWLDIILIGSGAIDHGVASHLLANSDVINFRDLMTSSQNKATANCSIEVYVKLEEDEIQSAARRCYHKSLAKLLVVFA